MAEERFVYVTYVRTTAEKLWEALIRPEFTRLYWFGSHQESEWRKGSAWRLFAPNGRLTDTGEVVEIDPPRRLVLSWRNEMTDEMRAEGYSRATFELEPADDTIKLTVTHEIGVAPSTLISAVSNGWPMVLSGLKSLLETGDGLALTRRWPKET